MTQKNPTVFVIAGPNGAGKTTAAKKVLEMLGDRFDIAASINADAIAHGINALHSEKVAFEAGKVMLKQIDALAAARQSFFFETTLSDRAYSHRITEMKKIPPVPLLPSFR